MTSDAARRQLDRERALIHTGCKTLGMSEDDRREMYWSVAGVRSFNELDRRGRARVIEHLRSRGFEPKTPRAGRKPNNFERMPMYVTKVEALLADMGLSWQYAESIAWRISGGRGRRQERPGTEKLEWFRGNDNWRALIAALHVEQEKRGLLASLDELLQGRGMTRDELARQCGFRGDAWTRKRAVLRRLIKSLLPPGIV